MTAGLVPHGMAVADVGTDHAYLPIHLVREGIAPRAIASDIREGPLQNAANAVARAGLQERIALRLSDGLREFHPGEANCWILAGMGGTLIARLLEQAPWLCSPETVLILQPMRHAWEARTWLLAHGFRIELEDACYDAGRLYHAMRAVYHPQYAMQNAQLSYVYTGALPQCAHPAAKELLARERALLETRKSALEKTGRAGEECTRLRNILHDWPEGSLATNQDTFHASLEPESAERV